MGLRNFDLSRRQVLVSSTSKGKAGAEVVLKKRDTAKLDAAAISPPGARVVAFDATDHAAAHADLDGFEADIGPVDILVNNAGQEHRTPLEDLPPEAFEWLFSPTALPCSMWVRRRRGA